MRKLFSLGGVFALSLALHAQLGVERNGPLPGPLPLFPADNWWNLDISAAPVAPNSAQLIAFINNSTTTSRQLHPDFGGYESPGSQNIYGMPYIVVPGDQPKVAVDFDYWDESDGGNPGLGIPFYPIPPEAITEPYWIEGGPPGNSGVGGDRHILIVDRDNKFLYELWDTSWTGSNWRAGSGARFDLKTNARRTEGDTSADAAGLAILPGLVRYDEAFPLNGTDEIRHAFRVTLRASNNYYVWPASHVAGNNTSALPFGARLRLKPTVNLSTYKPEIQRIFRAMQKYGLIFADNGSDMYISGAFDPRWDNDVLNPAFHSLRANDFEVIELGWKPTSTCAAPGAPQALSSIVNGQFVQLNWAAPASGGQSQYVLEAGSASGLANLATFVMGDTPAFSVTAPTGNYYVRTRSRNACGTSAPSNEIIVSVGGCAPPAAPANLQFTKSGALVTLNWGAVGGVQSYQLEAGSAPGLTNFFLGDVAGPLTATAPPGTYFVRVRARTACGLGPASNEIVVVL